VQQYDRRLPAMNIGRFMIFMLLVAVLGVPFALRPAQERSASGENVPSVVIVTPHVPQIRREFTEAFDRWHQRKFGTPVRVDWRVPGGTSEIIKQLEGQYHAAAAMGLIDFSEPKDPKIAPNVMSIDIMFGGGSYEHTRLKTGIKFKESGADKGERTIPLSIPAGFTQQQLDDWYGVNKIGSGFLYDPDQYWMGTALSAFGIVYNEDMFRKVFPDREQPFPQSFDDLADPKLIGLITLADPRQSGSVTTTFEAILNFYGWEKGWKLLREMCANTRSFTNSSPKTPLDVAQGEAAAGLTIDFYGRGQAQAIVKPGDDADTSRVGYVDPKGSTYIDADPISILRGAPNLEIAKRFVEFTLTDDAQALWQFHTVNHPKAVAYPKDADGLTLGPRHAELRRMPVRRAMYERYSDLMIDPLAPFEVASDVKPAGWRSAIGLMMGAFAVDVAHEQREAWGALNRARQSQGFPVSVLEEMERLFYAWPTTTVGEIDLEFTPSNYKAIRDSWRATGAQKAAEVQYTTYFRSNYERIVELERANMPN